MDKILFNIKDVQGYEDVATNFDIKRFNAYANSVQNINLRELLHDPLYHDLINNNTSSKYVNLIEGTTYTYSGKTIKYYGLKPFLCYIWLAYAAIRNDFFMSRKGNINFSSDDQQHFESAKQKNLVRQSYMENSVRYSNDTIQFLNENLSTYPLWEGGKDQKTTQFNMLLV